MKLTGKGVSDGVAIGRAFLYRAFACDVTEAHFDPGRENDYLARWEAAKAAGVAELDGIVALLEKRSGGKGDIFAAHREILLDEELDELVRSAISEERAMPDYAVYSAFAEFITMLGNVKDPLIAERVADFKDVRNRLIRILHGEKERNLSLLAEDVIVVAHDLLPSDTATMDRERVLGIVAEIGGGTSHSAIIARSYRIPAVLGVKDAMSAIKDGEELILDGFTGDVFTAPEPDMIKTYAKRREDFIAESALAEQYLTKPALLKTGEPVKIGVNIGDANPSDAYRVCDFVGLFRTEFLYMGSDHLPTEEEQFTAYKNVLLQAGDRPVTLRTLDIGGDKTLPYMELPKEGNPFLGKRAVRLCFDHPELFKAQLRAALRASAFGKLQIMFPMIGSIDDIRRAKAFVAEAKAELRDRGEAFDHAVPLGIMIEIPSIGLIAEAAAKETDFASIGTNDLCQYLCAVDRMNATVADFYQTFSPAFLRMLSLIIGAYNRAGKEISMCGELAGDPRAAALLIGLGLRKFSMSRSSVARVKMALARTGLSEAEALARRAMAAATQREVLDLLNP